MKPVLFVAAAAVVVAGAAYVLTRPAPGPAMAPASASTRPSAAPEGAPIVAVTLPATLSETAQIGQRAYGATCAKCHGEAGAGRNGSGPPLIHKIYEPSHHGDGAFFLAAQQGVRSHHWPFGDMPPQQGVTRADVEAIVAYVREVQRANGIN